MKTNQSFYWHIYSDGKKADIPFYTDADKVFAMNAVAVSAHLTGATVLALEVNDTHLHSVLKCPDGESTRKDLQGRIAKYNNRKDTPVRSSSDFYLACDLLDTREDALSHIIYTYRNCLDFYRKTPWNYPWGVGNIYFGEESTFVRGRKLSSISFREQFSLFHTGQKLPQDWEFNNSGLILPKSYVDYRHVEDLFGSPRAFIAFLYIRKDDEQRMKQELNGRYMESRRIQDLRERGKRLSNSYFGKSLEKIDLDGRLKIASKMLRDGEASRSESLAKALFLKKDDLTRLL